MEITKKGFSTIAFYLPQFHEIPENNEWWGKGFTEWTNTRRAMPQFSGHYQPHIPLNHNYYDLTDSKTFMWQISLAKQYGVDGFCFYHYWFKNGKKLLQKPIENYLNDKTLDLPFCISWANESWSRRWDGKEHEVLIEQDYGDKSDWIDHFYYLLPFFKDKRYIRIKGKPLVVIYRPEQIHELEAMLACWQNLASDNLLKGLYFAWQSPSYLGDKKGLSEKFDMLIEFEPFFSLTKRSLSESKVKRVSRFILSLVLRPNKAMGKVALRINRLLDLVITKYPQARFSAFNEYSYAEIVQVSTSTVITNPRSTPGAFCSWDNTPRRGANATFFSGTSPKAFQRYLALQIRRIKNLYSQKILFINAWNEWAEGAHLEPDEKFRLGYLEALNNAISED